MAAERAKSVFLANPYCYCFTENLWDSGCKTSIINTVNSICRKCASITAFLNIQFFSVHFLFSICLIADNTEY